MMNIVTIVGNGRTRTQAPHDDTTRVIWTMNNHALLWQKRTCAVFEMHDDALTTTRYDEFYKSWLRESHPVPVYMLNPVADIPSAIRYPLEEIGAQFGTHCLKGSRTVRDLYTSTTAYMIALALYLKFQRIEIYGVELDKANEYADHRDAVFFWLGKATALGVDIWVPEDCALYDDALYPTKGRQ